MKHLIIGSGNMGRKHGKILYGMGEAVTMADLGFDPAVAAAHDTIMLCTPPDTHASLIKLFGQEHLDKPLFCEKPVIAASGELEGAKLPKTSMVACNWRWCQCYDSIKQIECGYPHDPKYGYLDLIHFLDLYWERYGEPQRLSESHWTLPGNNRIANGAIIEGHGQEVRVVIWPSSTPWTEFCGKIIHRNGPCDMFERQMKVWLDVAAGKIKSPNPIEQAIERTEYLIEAFEGVKA